MPLSDHERRLLEEMEQALVAEDPKLVSTLSGLADQSGAHSRKRLGLSLALLLVGVIGLFVGLLTQLPIVGVLGFVVALLGTVSVIPKIGSPVGVKRGKGGGVNSKIQDRWNRRNLE